MNPLPANVPCVITGFVQAAFGQNVKVLAGTTLLAEISVPEASDGSVRLMSSAIFTSPALPGTLSLQFTNSGSQKSQIVSSYETVTFARQVFAGQWTFAVDDSATGGDCDFNDAVVTLSWTSKAG